MYHLWCKNALLRACSHEPGWPGYRDQFRFGFIWERSGRVLARISRNKATMAKHKGITFAHIIALATLNSCITAVKCDAYDVENTAGKARRCIHPGRWINPVFIPNNQAEVFIWQKFPARLSRYRLESPRSRELSQPALSYEPMENFTKDLEARSRKQGTCEEALNPLKRAWDK